MNTPECPPEESKPLQERHSFRTGGPPYHNVMWKKHLVLQATKRSTNPDRIKEGGKEEGIVEYAVIRRAAIMSRFIKEKVAEDMRRTPTDEERENGMKTIIPLDVEPEYLELIIAYIGHHWNHPVKPLPRPLLGRVEEYCSSWDADYFHLCLLEDQDERKSTPLVEIMKIAKFLQIQELSNFSSACFVTICKGKTSQQIRDTFGITNDLPSPSPELEKEVCACASTIWTIPLTKSTVHWSFYSQGDILPLSPAMMAEKGGSKKQKRSHGGERGAPAEASLLFPLDGVVGSLAFMSLLLAVPSFSPEDPDAKLFVRQLFTKSLAMLPQECVHALTCFSLNSDDNPDPLKSFSGLRKSLLRKRFDYAVSPKSYQLFRCLNVAPLLFAQFYHYPGVNGMALSLSSEDFVDRLQTPAPFPIAAFVAAYYGDAVMTQQIIGSVLKTDQPLLEIPLPRNPQEAKRIRELFTSIRNGTFTAALCGACYGMNKNLFYALVNQISEEKGNDSLCTFLVKDRVPFVFPFRSAMEPSGSGKLGTNCFQFLGLPLPLEGEFIGKGKTHAATRKSILDALLYCVGYRVFHIRCMAFDSDLSLLELLCCYGTNSQRYKGENGAVCGLVTEGEIQEEDEEEEDAKGKTTTDKKKKKKNTEQQQKKSTSSSSSSALVTSSQEIDKVNSHNNSIPSSLMHVTMFQQFLDYLLSILADIQKPTDDDVKITFVKCFTMIIQNDLPVVFQMLAEQQFRVTPHNKSNSGGGDAGGLGIFLSLSKKDQGLLMRRAMKELRREIVSWMVEHGVGEKGK